MAEQYYICDHARLPHCSWDDCPHSKPHTRQDDDYSNGGRCFIDSPDVCHAYDRLAVDPTRVKCIPTKEIPKVEQTPDQKRVEQVVSIAARIHDARAMMRDLLDYDYDKRIEPFRTMIREDSRERGCSALEAALDMAKRATEKNAGNLLGFILAAAADVCEEEPDETES